MTSLQLSTTVYWYFFFSDIVVRGKPFVTSGETITIVCNISGVTDIPQDLDWFKDGTMLRPMGRKISISKDISIANKKLHSVLEIRNSKLEDSGTYVCRNSELLIASQRVQVLNGKWKVHNNNYFYMLTQVTFSNTKHYIINLTIFKLV